MRFSPQQPRHKGYEPVVYWMTLTGERFTKGIPTIPYWIALHKASK